MINLQQKMAFSETTGATHDILVSHYGQLDMYAARARSVWEWDCKWNKGATELTVNSREGGTLLIKVAPPDLQ